MTCQRATSRFGPDAAHAMSRTNKSYDRFHPGWRAAVPLNGRYSTFSK